MRKLGLRDSMGVNRIVSRVRARVRSRGGVLLWRGGGAGILDGFLLQGFI